MKKNILMLVVCTFVFFSCTNEDDLVKPNIEQTKDFELVSLREFTAETNSINLRSTAIEDDQLVIRFKDEASYERTMEKLEGMSKKERMAWSTTLEGFNSLQEIFNQAMIDVENVDETEASYMAFKEKYDQYLYFPMYKEDMGFYMPVIEQEKAALASSDGFIVVGNEVKNLKNITCYADLQKSGQAYYSPDENVSTRAYSGYNTDSDFIGKEIDSGWFHDKDDDRKLRFKFGRKGNKGNIAPIPPNNFGGNFKMHLKLEISFRKKTWMGWVNYSSETRTKMEFIVDGQKFNYSHNEDGYSSHDWMDDNVFPWYFTGRYLNGVGLLYTPAIGVKLETYYRAFDTPDGTSTIKWTYDLPGEDILASR